MALTPRRSSWAWSGPAEQAEQQLVLLRSSDLLRPDLIWQISYRDLQTMSHPAVRAGSRRYWKSGDLPELSDDLLDVILSMWGYEDVTGL